MAWSCCIHQQLDAWVLPVGCFNAKILSRQNETTVLLPSVMTGFELRVWLLTTIVLFLNSVFWLITHLAIWRLFVLIWKWTTVQQTVLLFGSCLFNSVDVLLWWTPAISVLCLPLKYGCKQGQHDYSVQMMWDRVHSWKSAQALCRQLVDNRPKC